MVYIALYIATLFIGVIVYADDIILLSCSFCGVNQHLCEIL